jgi:hypothetical protein
MPRSEQGYLRLPRKVVSDSNMLSSDVRVLAVLLDLSSPKREVDAGLEVISDRTGLTKRTVCESLLRLESKNFISRESRRGPYTGIIRLKSQEERLLDNNKNNCGSDSAVDPIKSY